MMKVFKESQRLTNTWFWLLLGSLGSFFILVLIRQLFLGLTVGNHPAPDAVLLLFSLIPFAIISYFFFVRLYTTYDGEGIKISYFPYGTKIIPWTDIKKAEVITYSFVGYGLRFSPKYGRVYNIRGNKGVQLKTSDGDYLIGTSKPEEVKEILREYYRSV